MAALHLNHTTYSCSSRISACSDGKDSLTAHTALTVTQSHSPSPKYPRVTFTHPGNIHSLIEPWAGSCLLANPAQPLVVPHHCSVLPHIALPSHGALGLGTTALQRPPYPFARRAGGALEGGTAWADVEQSGGRRFPGAAPTASLSSFNLTGCSESASINQHP